MFWNLSESIDHFHRTWNSQNLIFQKQFILIKIGQIPIKRLGRNFLIFKKIQNK